MFLSIISSHFFGGVVSLGSQKQENVPGEYMIELRLILGTHPLDPPDLRSLSYSLSSERADKDQSFTAHLSALSKNVFVFCMPALTRSRLSGIPP